MEVSGDSLSSDNTQPLNVYPVRAGGVGRLPKELPSVINFVSE